MVEFVLIIISFAIIIFSIKSIVNESSKSKFDEILNNISNTPINKGDKIKQFINKGYKDDEICKEFNIGRGELLLIKKCYEMS